MRILLVITGLGMGGAERQVVDLADAFAELGHEVVLAYLTGSVQLRPISPTVRVVPLKISKSPWRTIRALRLFVRLVKAFRPDIVHSHMVHANLFSRLSRLFVAYPMLINTAHSNNEGGWWRMCAYRLTDSLADLSTNVSSGAVAAFEHRRAVPFGRMKVIHNGIDVAKYSYSSLERARIRTELGLGEADSLVLAVGRLSTPKDYPCLIRAAATLRQRQINAVVIVVGDGPLRDQLVSMVRAEGLDAGQFRFLGMRWDIPSLMSAADVFVLSSAWEGFGLVVAEAMSCERVVVATDCGGVAEVVGDCGFLVRSRDAEGLATTLQEALALPQESKVVLGAKARARICEQFSIESTVCKWIDVYSRMYFAPVPEGP
jgi:glycosyltransferase involved in cell wall biosynthesis